MPPRRNVVGAMFDVKPVDQSGRIDVDKIHSLPERVNLRQQSPAHVRVTGPHTDRGKNLEIHTKAEHSLQHQPIILEIPEHLIIPHTPMAKTSAAVPREVVLREFENVLGNEMNVVDVVQQIGGRYHQGQGRRSSHMRNTRSPAKPLLPRPDFYEPQISSVTPASKAQLEQFWRQAGQAVSVRQHSHTQFVSRSPVDLAVSQPSSPVAREIEQILQPVVVRHKLLSPLTVGPSKPLKKQRSLPPSQLNFASHVKPGSGHRSSSMFWRHWGMSIIVSVLLVVFVFWLSYSRGLLVKNNVLQNGGNAVANLETAKEDLASYHFGKAADDFALAYDDLHRASGTLDSIGASLMSILGHLPGFNKINAANNLIGAGQNIAKAGEYLSRAFNTLYQAHLSSFLDYKDSSNRQSIATLAREFRDVLTYADANITHAHNLLADIDPSAIPEDKKPLLDKFESKVPEFRQYIDSALAYSDFLLRFVGERGDRRYLVLFENNSELRATGGFSGSYALVTFHDGALADVKMDDVYNIDGQLKEHIIPPVPLQHITPTLGMRDVAWFADFPTSAQKIEEYYKKDGGQNVDGVIALTPDVIMDILRVAGPIDMPEYHLQLTADNFLAQIQEEVEYGSNRAQPKTILKDFQPQLFAVLAGQSKDTWLAIFKGLLTRIEQKHVVAYFNDKTLEDFVAEHSIGGQIKSTADDYLEVVYTNVKGSKTDAFTDNALNLSVTLKDSIAEHTLTISRKHNGGDQANGFYNRPNPAYIRVYVPRGAVLDGVTGQTITNYQSLIDYTKDDFKSDPDIATIESTEQHPLPGVDVSQESGKTVFGFWLVINPKASQSVIVRYHLPHASDRKYALTWQKQIGTKQDPIHLNLSLPTGARILNTVPDLKTFGNALVWDTDLSIDRELQVNFQ